MICCSVLNASRRSTAHLLLRLALAAAASCWLVPSFRIVGGGTVLNEDVKALKKKTVHEYQGEKRFEFRKCEYCTHFDLLVLGGVVDGALAELVKH
jgi:hypothetical protein